MEGGERGVGGAGERRGDCGGVDGRGWGVAGLCARMETEAPAAVVSAAASGRGAYDRGCIQCDHECNYARFCTSSHTFTHTHTGTHTHAHTHTCTPHTCTHTHTHKQARKTSPPATQTSVCHTEATIGPQLTLVCSHIQIRPSVLNSQP